MIQNLGVDHLALKVLVVLSSHDVRGLEMLGHGHHVGIDHAGELLVESKKVDQKHPYFAPSYHVDFDHPE